MARSRYLVNIVFLTFFVMSLLTNILGPLVPDIISSFHVSLAAAAFLPFSFFIAYGVMSIPAGFLIERFGEKPVMIAAFLAGTAGSLSFALHPTYQVAVVSLFVMGSGMATLQSIPCCASREAKSISRSTPLSLNSSSESHRSRVLISIPTWS